MAVDCDAKLTSLAAEILRDAVQVNDLGDLQEWVVGCQPVLAAGQLGMFPGSREIAGTLAATGSGYGDALTVSLKALFGLGGRLPGVRLPGAAELAALARSAPLIAALEALASWLGPDGRPVTEADELSAADAADAAARLGVRPGYLPYLWEYALASCWLEIDESGAGSAARAIPGETALRWAAGDEHGDEHGDEQGTLRAWAVVFAAVLACALDVAGPRRLNLQAQGVVACLTLFLQRRAGLSVPEVSELVMAGAIGGQPTARASRAWDAWVREHGDPAHFLLGELAALNAVTLPGSGTGRVELTGIALWALREQLELDGVRIALIPASPQSAADLAAMAEGMPEDEFETEADAWVARRGPDAAARELLTFAAGSGATDRLVAVNLARRIGIDGHLAWRDAMARPELRGYARIALTVLASQLPGSTLPLVLEPHPDDVTWVATDLLALACGDDYPDPGQVAAQFREAVPAGEESWIFDLMSRSTHPDVVRVLTVLARHHPDRRVAREARRAAHTAARGRTAVSH